MNDTLAVEIEPMLAKEAAERQKEGQKRGGETAGKGRRKQTDSIQERIPESCPTAQSREQAAKITGTNGRYVGGKTWCQVGTK